MISSMLSNHVPRGVPKTIAVKPNSVSTECIRSVRHCAWQWLAWPSKGLILLSHSSKTGRGRKGNHESAGPKSASRTSKPLHIRLTLEQHGFEPCEFAYTQISSNKIQYQTCIFFSYYFLNMFFSLASFIVSYTCNKQNMCLSTVYLVRLPVNSGLLVVKFWSSQMLYVDF